MHATTNYELPLYEGGDSVNLIAGYNVAMEKIDTALKTLEAKFEPHPATDADFDVSKLGNAKITDDGIVYFVA